MRTLSYISFGVAAVGVGAGVLFEVLSAGKKSDADKLCNLPGGACPDTLKDQVNQLDDAAKSDRTLAIVGFAVGGAALAAGVALFVGGTHDAAGDESPRPTARRAPAIHPWLGINAAGVSGTF